MPRLNKRLSNAVFFLYRRNPKTGEIDGPIGTGFFLTTPIHQGRSYNAHVYAVTCHHVMVSGGTIIRVNDDLGGHAFIETEPHEWGFIPGGDDLVVFDITDNEIVHKYNNVRYIPFNMIITSSYIHTNEINIGEDGFMLGMFADHYGEVSNLIPARFGNISLMADESAPIRKPNKSARPSFLFDLRSRPGFSGSPVFVYRTPAGDLRYASERGKDEIERISRRAEHDRLSRDPRWAGRLHDEDDHSEQMDHIHENTFLMLLGVHCGQFSDVVDVVEDTDDKGRSVKTTKKLKMPNSTTIVVPAWQLIEALNQPEMVEQRKKREIQNERRTEPLDVGEANSADIITSDGGNTSPK